MVVEKFPGKLIGATSARAEASPKPRWIRILGRFFMLAGLSIAAAATAHDFHGNAYGGWGEWRSRPGGIEGRSGYYQPILPTRPLHGLPAREPVWGGGHPRYDEGRCASPRRSWGRGEFPRDRFVPAPAQSWPGRAREGFGWRQGWR